MTGSSAISLIADLPEPADIGYDPKRLDDPWVGTLVAVTVTLKF